MQYLLLSVLLQGGVTIRGCEESLPYGATCSAVLVPLTSTHPEVEALIYQAAEHGLYPRALHDVSFSTCQCLGLAAERRIPGDRFARSPL
jgi:hypothetical protein